MATPEDYGWTRTGTRTYELTVEQEVDHLYMQHPFKAVRQGVFGFHWLGDSWDLFDMHGKALRRGVTVDRLHNTALMEAARDYCQGRWPTGWMREVNRRFEKLREQYRYGR